MARWADARPAAVRYLWTRDRGALRGAGSVGLAAAGAVVLFGSPLCHQELLPALGAERASNALGVGDLSQKYSNYFVKCLGITRSMLIRATFATVAANSDTKVC